jgi:hypothetical protein
MSGNDVNPWILYFLVELQSFWSTFQNNIYFKFTPWYNFTYVLSTKNCTWLSMSSSISRCVHRSTYTFQYIQNWLYNKAMELLLIVWKCNILDLVTYLTRRNKRGQNNITSFWLFLTLFHNLCQFYSIIYVSSWDKMYLEVTSFNTTKTSWKIITPKLLSISSHFVFLFTRFRKENNAIYTHLTQWKSTVTVHCHNPTCTNVFCKWPMHVKLLLTLKGPTRLSHTGTCTVLFHVTIKCFPTINHHVQDIST